MKQSSSVDIPKMNSNYTASSSLLLNSLVSSNSSSCSSSLSSSPQFTTGSADNTNQLVSSSSSTTSSTNQNDDYLDTFSDDMDLNNSASVPSTTSPSKGQNSADNSSASARLNRFFPDTVVEILNKWFYENQEYPYPNESMTNMLAKEANISAKQVRKWFANKRVRSNKCYKLTFRNNRTKDNFKNVVNCSNNSSFSGSRRQSKSISDADMFGDFELNNTEMVNSGMKRQKQRLTGSVSMTPTIASPSFSQENPQLTNSYEQQYPTNVAQTAQDFLLNLNIWKNAIDMTTKLNKTEETVSPQIGAFYNPYLLMNFFQNQAAMNKSYYAPPVEPTISTSPQLIKREPETYETIDDSNRCEQQLQQNNSPKNSMIKRKTLLSSCFMNDLNKLMIDSNSPEKLNTTGQEWIKEQNDSLLNTPQSSLSSSFSSASVSSSYNLNDSRRSSTSSSSPDQTDQMDTTKSSSNNIFFFISNKWPFNNN